MMKLFASLAWIAAAVLLAISSFAQAPEGTLAGTVWDTQGALVAGAKVSVEAVGFRVTRTSSTNGRGEFRVPTLLPGQYRIHIEAAGFGQQDLSVKVPVGGNPSVRVVLDCAGATRQGRPHSGIQFDQCSHFGAGAVSRYVVHHSN